MLKEHNRQFALILSLSGVAILFFTAVSELSDIINSVFSLASYSDSSLGYTKLMLKILGLTLITRIVCEVCRDNGENALASMTSTIAKIIVVSFVLPLFETVIGIIGGLIK